MYWHLVHTKPRQEACALENLQRQGYTCYMPTLSVEKLRQGGVVVAAVPLFPRYLFIRLGQGESAQSWAPIRSTRGVSRLVCFGTEPAKVPDDFIAALRAREAHAHTAPQRLFEQGDRVRLLDGPFIDVEGIYHLSEGDHRAMVLIEILSKPVVVSVARRVLRKVG